MILTCSEQRHNEISHEEGRTNLRLAVSLGFPPASRLNRNPLQMNGAFHEKETSVILMIPDWW